MQRTLAFQHAVAWLWPAAVAALVLGAILAICLAAPAEETMGDAQRIIYIHVAVAWCGLAGFIAMGVCGTLYLVRRDLAYDRWAQAAAEVGWLCCSLTLATGSLWAYAAWNTWWTWDPRLATSFVLWAAYSVYLLIRAGIDDALRRARLGAVLAIVGVLDVPMVVFATRWFRGIHPTAPGMEPLMRIVLCLAILAFSALFGLLVVRRQAQLETEALIFTLEQAAERREAAN